MGTSKPAFTMHEEPIYKKIDIIDLKAFHVLLGGGVIDRAEPTLIIVGLEIQGHADEATILRIVLSPFSQVVTEVGRAALGDSPTMVLNFGPLFGLVGGACPSLLLSPTMLPDWAVGKLYALFFGARENGYHLLEGVRKYPVDPFKRVGRERKILRTGGHQTQDRKLTGDEALELATGLLHPKAIDMEWKAFILAWDEAVKSRREETPGVEAMSLKRFLSAFSALQPTCRIKWGALKREA